MAQPPGIVYSTTIPYSGTASFPSVNAVVTDAAGNSYVAGIVYSNGLTSTPGVVQAQYAGGACPVGNFGLMDPCADAFVAKFDSSGTLIFLTYLGGTGNDVPNAVTVDASGNIYVGGTTSSSDFPLAGSAWRPPLSTDGTSFLAKLSGDGTTLIWSTVVNGVLVQIALAPNTSLFYLAQGGVTTTLTELTSAGQFIAAENLPQGSATFAIGTDGYPQRKSCKNEGMSVFPGFPRVTPFLWFDANAEEAVDFYIGIFKNSRRLDEVRNPGDAPVPKGSILTLSFELDGQKFTALNGGPHFKFTEAISMVVRCDSQEEIDYYWSKLSAGGQEVQCGWLKDQFGLSWQIVPAQIHDLIKTPKGMEAMMKMVKLNIAEIERAAKS